VSATRIPGAEFIGYLNIPGEYNIITSAIVKGDLFLIVQTADEIGVRLYRVDLETAVATLLNVQVSAEDLLT
jgi:hypothetical protein